jgi:deoxyribodipyrimidine photo-lyase
VPEFSNALASDIISKDTVVVWLRRDLRLDDNAALYHALKENQNVIPIFIFDTEILDALEDKRDARVHFIHEMIVLLKEQLESLGTSLLVLHGNPVDIFSALSPKAVYSNRDYEPYARERDKAISENLTKRGIEFKTFKDHVIFERDEIMKADGSPYTVFTPYSRKWKANLNDYYLKNYSVSRYFENFKKVSSLPLPSLEDIGFRASTLRFPERKIKLSVIENYDKYRDFPASNGTTRLSVHLRFGTVSIRKLVQIALKRNDIWLSELIWREFYQMILWHFPSVVINSFNPAYDKIIWRNDVNEFQAWCKGRTGYAIVDAGMRELNATGFMHNRVRMIVASFLTKHLLIDWRWGEAYFAKKLLDYELASNNGGWQWAAGSGSDAAPYFRMFNPQLQTEKFDPDNEYIDKWVPEHNTPDYVAPIVDHKRARERALTAYRAAVGQH